MNIIIIGPAGSGKGTMSSKIVGDYKVYHLATGNLLRKEIDEQRPLGDIFKKILKSGRLVPDDLINKLVDENIRDRDVSNGIISDGFPRTLNQAVEYDKILASLGKKVDVVINLVVDYDVLVDRITGRQTCPNCSEIYHKITRPSKVKDICDVCKAELVQRVDDSLEQLKIRLKEHTENSSDIINYYKEKDILYNVDSSQEVDKVYSDIKEIFERLL